MKYIEDRLDYLYKSRPTAVDLGNAIKALKVVVRNVQPPSDESDGQEHLAAVRDAYINAAEKIFRDDYGTNLAIGRYGAEYLRRQQLPIDPPPTEDCELRYFTTSPPGTQGLPDRTYRKLSVLTHCNTG